MKIKFLVLMLTLVSLAAFADPAFACSCGAKPSVFDSFEGSDMVVIATAVSVEMKKGADKIDFEARNKKQRYDESYRYVKSIKMRVDKIYKGNVKVGDVLTFISGDGVNCGITFGKDSVGDSFLFYLYNPSPDEETKGKTNIAKTPVYGVSFCGRSQPIVGYETDDLKYLNNLDKVKGKTRISGDFGCWGDCPSFANLEIKIIGDQKTYQTRTDANGIYEIYDLPPGKYLLEPEIPKGWKFNRYMIERSPAFHQMEYLLYSEEKPDLSKQIPVVLEAGKHTGIDFFFDIDTAIRGKVLSPGGEPMKGVCVKAVSTELKEGDYRGRWSCTNEEGIFVVEEMPPGTYILVANDDGKLSEDEPFETLFYPNAAQYKDAKTIEVKLGERLDGFVIRVPKTEELVTISGRWTYSDGAPVADEWIEYDVDEKSEKIDGKQSVTTDKNGNFSFKVLKGLKGSFYGKMYTYVGEFENCPQIDEAVKKASNGKTSGYLNTKTISVAATENAPNSNLKFPFLSCRKKN